MFRFKKARTFEQHVEGAKMFDDVIEKFNPYHGKDGRFTSANGAASFTYKPGASRAHDLAITGAVARDAVAKAKAAEPKLTSDMQNLAKKYGGTMVGLEYAVKGAGSLRRKLNTEMNEIEAATGKRPPASEVVKKMYDVNRYTMQGDEKNLASMANGALKDLKGSGYEIVQVKNTLWDDTAPYRGINCKLKSSDGAQIELQFHTARSLEVKEVNHKLYETARKDNTSAARREQLNAEMAANAKSIPTPDNIQSVGKI